MRTVTVDDEDSTIIIYDNWRQVSQTTLPTLPAPSLGHSALSAATYSMLRFFLAFHCGAKAQNVPFYSMSDMLFPDAKVYFLYFKIFTVMHMKIKSFSRDKL